MIDGCNDCVLKEVVDWIMLLKNAACEFTGRRAVSQAAL